MFNKKGFMLLNIIIVIQSETIKKAEFIGISDDSIGTTTTSILLKFDFAS